MKINQSVIYKCEDKSLCDIDVSGANGYNKMQRNSSSRDSAHTDPHGSALTDPRGSSHTDSGILCSGDSHIYSEPTEDPGAYLEPVRIRLDPDEEMYGGDMSLMEGSVADTDYMDDFTRRGGGCPGGARAPGQASPRTLNIDKYKVRDLWILLSWYVSLDQIFQESRVVDFILLFTHQCLIFFNSFLLVDYLNADLL